MNHPNRRDRSSKSNMLSGTGAGNPIRPTELPQIAENTQIIADALPDVPNCYQSADAPESQTAQIANTPAGSLTDLTGPQLTAIELIAQGKPDRLVADTVAVHTKTVTRWRLYHVGFRAELSRRRHEVWGAAADRFRGLLEKALDVFARNLASRDKLVAHRAAGRLLSLARKFAPPDEPIDSAGVLDAHARFTKRSMRSTDPMIEPVYEEDLDDARKDLMRKLSGEFETATARNDAVASS